VVKAARRLSKARRGLLSPLENPADGIHIEFRAAVIVIDAVLLLLNVGELRVAIAGDVGVAVQGIYQPFQAW
jgi:hypothetical protein